MNFDYRNVEFEIHGYSKDYYIDKKYIGSIRVENPDREKFGYEGRREEVLEEDIQFHNKKIIKKGSIVMTELHQICGRIKKPKKNPDEKYYVLIGS